METDRLHTEKGRLGSLSMRVYFASIALKRVERKYQTIIMTMLMLNIHFSRKQEQRAPET